MPRERIICQVCGKEFTSSFANFRRHLRHEHNINEEVEYTVICKEPMCNFTSSKLENLRQHLEIEHEIVQEVDDLYFRNIEEFHKWKLAEERRCSTSWTKRRIIKKLKITTIYYYCSRSGKKRLVAAHQRKRRTRKQGSRKIDLVCTSTIIVKIVPQCIMVKYYKNHYGHDNVKTQTRTVKHSNNNHKRIKTSHLMATNSQNMLAVKFNDGWIVLVEDKSYSVKRNDLEDNHLCDLTCEDCFSCIHCYICTCTDFMVNNNMCEHIHKVCMSEPQSPKEDVETTQKEIKRNICSIMMSDWRHITDRYTLNKIDDHLMSALNLIACEQEVIEESEGPVIPRVTKYVNIQEVPNYCLVIPPQVTYTLHSKENRILSQYRPILPANETLNNAPPFMPVLTGFMPILTALPNNGVQI